MRMLAIGLLLYSLLVLCSCGEQRVECQPDGDGFFMLDSLDMRFDPFPLLESDIVALDATLVGIPSTEASGLLILRDEEGNDYRFEQRHDMNWGGQLDGLRLGETYHFVLSPSSRRGQVAGVKVFDGESLLYLAASYSTSVPPYSAFGSSGLEGFTVEQLHESECECVRTERNGFISLRMSLPVVFQYGDQRVTLYQTQEAVFTTPHGEFLVHLLYSVDVDPQNFYDGGKGYSFYVKRL